MTLTHQIKCDDDDDEPTAVSRHNTRRPFTFNSIQSYSLTRVPVFHLNPIQSFVK